MRARTHEFNKKMFSELPAEIVKALGIRPGDEIEFTHVHGNVVVVAPAQSAGFAGLPAGATEEKRINEIKLTEKELSVMKKINYIKHLDRTLEKITKTLSKSEKEIFDGLIAKKVLFIYAKEKRELVGISREYFKFLEPAAKTGEQKSVEYAIVDYPGEASELMKKNPNIKGVRGFDKKFYLIDQARLFDIGKKLEKVLKKEKSLVAIADELRIKEDLCRAAIENLREEGSVIEKKKDMYILA